MSCPVLTLRKMSRISDAPIKLNAVMSSFVIEDDSFALWVPVVNKNYLRFGPVVNQTVMSE